MSASPFDFVFDSCPFGLLLGKVQCLVLFAFILFSIFIEQSNTLGGLQVKIKAIKCPEKHLQFSGEII